MIVKGGNALINAVVVAYYLMSFRSLAIDIDRLPLNFVVFPRFALKNIGHSAHNKT